MGVAQLHTVGMKDLDPVEPLAGLESADDTPQGPPGQLHAPGCTNLASLEGSGKSQILRATNYAAGADAHDKVPAAASDAPIGPLETAEGSQEGQDTVEESAELHDPMASREILAPHKRRRTRLMKWASNSII